MISGLHTLEETTLGADVSYFCNSKIFSEFLLEEKK